MLFSQLNILLNQAKFVWFSEIFMHMQENSLSKLQKSYLCFDPVGFHRKINNQFIIENSISGMKMKMMFLIMLQNYFIRTNSLHPWSHWPHTMHQLGPLGQCTKIKELNVCEQVSNIINSGRWKVTLPLIKIRTPRILSSWHKKLDYRRESCRYLKKTSAHSVSFLRCISISTTDCLPSARARNQSWDQSL